MQIFDYIDIWYHWQDIICLITITRIHRQEMSVKGFGYVLKYSIGAPQGAPFFMVLKFELCAAMCVNFCNIIARLGFEILLHF